MEIYKKEPRFQDIINDNNNTKLTLTRAGNSYSYPDNTLYSATCGYDDYTLVICVRAKNRKSAKSRVKRFLGAVVERI